MKHQLNHLLVLLVVVATLFLCVESALDPPSSPTELKRSTSTGSATPRQRPRLDSVHEDVAASPPGSPRASGSPPGSPHASPPSSPTASGKKKKHTIVYVDGAVISTLLKEKQAKMAMLSVAHAKQMPGIGKAAGPSMAGMTVQNDAEIIRTLGEAYGFSKEAKQDRKWYKREIVEYDSSSTAGAPSGFTNVAVSKDFHSSNYKTYRPGLKYGEDDTAGTRKCQVPGDTKVKQTFYFVNSADTEQRFFVIRRSGFEIEKKAVNVAPSGGFPTGVNANTPFPVATHPGEKCEDPAHYAKLHLAMDFTVTKSPLSGSHTFKCPPMNGDAVKQSEKTIGAEYAPWMECLEEDEFTVEGGQVNWIDDPSNPRQSVCVKHTFPQDRDWTHTDPSAYCCVPDCVLK